MDDSCFIATLARQASCGCSRLAVARIASRSNWKDRSSTRQWADFPDGHWIAYSSDASGREEIYVRAFDALSAAGSSAGGKSIRGKWMVSRDGGTRPLWRRDGNELLFLSSDGTAMAVEVETHGVFRAGIPKALFKVPTSVEFWDVSSDGKRFLMPATSAAVRPFTVVLNWQAALNK